MLTPFGKALRALRSEHGLLLKEMADHLMVSSAFLSAVETGRKSVPADFRRKISAHLSLDRSAEAELQQAIDQSAKEVRLKLPENMAGRDRETASVLARQFGSLSSSDFEELRKILHRRRS